MDKVKEYAKSIVTFLATIVINMVISLLQGEQPWPQTQEEWIRYLGTAFTAALATAVPRNKMTQKQLDTAIVKGDLIPPVAPVGATPIAWSPPPPPPPPPPPHSAATLDQIIADYEQRS